MKISRKQFFNPIINTFFEGEGGGEGGGSGEGQGGTGAGAGGTGAGAGGAGAGGAGGDEKKFSQKDMDAAIKNRFKKEREEKEKLVADLQKLQETATLTEQQKEDLSQKIEALQSSMKTTEQLAAEKAKKLEDKYSVELKKANEDRDLWKGRFTSETIRRAITDAGIGAGALEPTQLVMMFGSATRLVDELDKDGKPTGNFVPMLKFQGLDPETKKPALLDLPVADAIAHMRDNKLHTNLFGHGATPGTGSSGGGGTGKSGAKGMPEREHYASDSEYSVAYQAWREDHDFDGTPIRK